MKLAERGPKAPGRNRTFNVRTSPAFRANGVLELVTVKSVALLPVNSQLVILTRLLVAFVIVIAKGALDTFSVCCWKSIADGWTMTPCSNPPLPDSDTVCELPP